MDLEGLWCLFFFQFALNTLYYCTENVFVVFVLYCIDIFSLCLKVFLSLKSTVNSVTSLQVLHSTKLTIPIKSDLSPVD